MFDLDSSCAAANDFFRLMEGTELLVEKLKDKYHHLSWDEAGSEDSPMAVLSRKMLDLLSLYSGDAVYAAQRVHFFVFQTVRKSSIQTDLFSRNWELKFAHNQVALSLVKTIEDYLSDSQRFLCNEFLYNKAVDALVKATVCFYVRCLIQKSDNVRHRRRNGRSPDGRLPFKNPARALSRISYDIQYIQNCFQGLANELPALARLVERELSVLIVIHEFLGIAVGRSSMDSLEQLIIVLHKRTGGNLMVTHYLVGDLWFLVAPSAKKNSVHETIGAMKTELQMISKGMKETEPSDQPLDKYFTGLNLNEMLKDIYEERRMQEETLCGPFMRSMKEPSPETRQEIHTSEHEAPKSAPVVQMQDPADDLEWLDINESDCDTTRDEMTRKRNPVVVLGVFLQEKFSEILDRSKPVLETLDRSKPGRF